MEPAAAPSAGQMRVDVSSGTTTLAVCTPWASRRGLPGGTDDLQTKTSTATTLRPNGGHERPWQRTLMCCFSPG